jgi:hypothetical protein
LKPTKPKIITKTLPQKAESWITPSSSELVSEATPAHGRWRGTARHWIGRVWCVLAHPKSRLRVKLVSILANCDPLLHVFQFNLLHPGMFRISGNRVAQPGSQLLQFYEAHLV